MKNKVLLDSNILVYALEDSNPFYDKASAVCLDIHLDLFVTTKNISEYFAVCSKLNVPFEKSWLFYQSLCKNATLLFPNTTSLAISALLGVPASLKPTPRRRAWCFFQHQAHTYSTKPTAH